MKLTLSIHWFVLLIIFIQEKFEFGGLKSCAEFIRILNEQETNFVENEEMLTNFESLAVALRTQSNRCAIKNSIFEVFKSFLSAILIFTIYNSSTLQRMNWILFRLINIFKNCVTIFHFF